MIDVAITTQGGARWLALFDSLAEYDSFRDGVNCLETRLQDIRARMPGEHGEGSFRHIQLRPSHVTALEWGMTE